MTTHQSHEGEAPGQTDSSHKLSRLKMPEDLSGKRVLDIGCNEGFFSNAAATRGAASVIGIDMDERFLAEARRRYTRDNIEFRRQSWATLPDGPFDLVMWTSAMHYELDPASVLRSISDVLAPDGLLILECGVVQSSRLEFVYSVRHDGGLWYPTLPLIENILDDVGFAYRVVAQSELVGTDPVPRSVFHANNRLPTVLIVAGETKKGKTGLATLLKRSATKILELDYFVSRIATAKHAITPIQKLIKEAYDGSNLSRIYKSIDEHNLTDAYLTLVAASICASDRLVVIEGYMTDRQLELLEQKLAPRCRVWNVERV